MKKIELQDYCNAGNSVLESFDPKILKALRYKTKYSLNFFTVGDEISGLTYGFWIDAQRSLMWRLKVDNFLHQKLWANERNMNKCFPTIETWITFLKYLIKSQIINQSLGDKSTSP